MVLWIEANLVHGPGDVEGQPIVLDDEQVAFLLRAYTIDAKGRRMVRRAVYSRPKGRAKSEFGAMIACAEAVGPVRFAGWERDGTPTARAVTSPLIRCAATEEGQADNTYEAVRFMLAEGAVSAMPGLDVGLTRTYTPGGGAIVPITAKASSKDGGKETFALFDETHLYVGAELHRLHDTIRRNLAKRKMAEPWAMETSTMYAPGEESVAEASHKYAQAIADGKIVDPGFLFDHRSGPIDFDWDDDEQLRAAFRQAYGAASEWTDIERLVMEARDPANDKNDVIRYFLNNPAKRTDGQWIRDLDWEHVADGPDGIPDGASVCIGGDGSRTFDTTVIAWASKSDDGRIDVDAHVFSLREDAPHHTLHHGGHIDFEDVEEFVIEGFSRWNVREACYDPRYLDRSADLIRARLPESRIDAVYPNSHLMREALMAFERGVIDGTVRHRGDPVIAHHVAAAGVERGDSNEIRRVRKIEQRKPIDAVIAMALAYWRVARGDGGVSRWNSLDLVDDSPVEAVDEAADLHRARMAYAASVYDDGDD